MTLAPGVYSRNRHFDLYRHADVARARRRAAELRGIARQLGTLGVAELTLEERPGARWAIRFTAPSVSLRRQCLVTRAELAALRTVVARRGESPLAADAEDGAVVAAVLLHLPDAFVQHAAQGEGGRAEG